MEPLNVVAYLPGTEYLLARRQDGQLVFVNDRQQLLPAEGQHALEAAVEKYGYRLVPTPLLVATAPELQAAQDRSLRER